MGPLNDNTLEGSLQCTFTQFIKVKSKKGTKTSDTFL